MPDLTANRLMFHGALFGVAVYLIVFLVIVLMQNCYICFKLTYESQIVGVSTARRHCVHNRHSCCYNDIVSRQVLCQGDSHRPTTPSSDVLLNRSRTPTPAGEFDMQVRE